MFTYSFKNLRSLFTKQRLLAFLLVLNIVASAFVLCFSYGVYRNYDEIRERGEVQSDITKLSVWMDSDNWGSVYEGEKITTALDIKPQMLIDFAKSLSDDTNDNIEYIGFNYWVETPMCHLDSVTQVSDNEYWIDRGNDNFYSDDADPHWYQLFCRFKIVDGRVADYTDDRFISYDQYDNGEKVIAVSESIFNSNYTIGGYNSPRMSYSRKYVHVGTNSLIFGGERYKIVSKYDAYEVGGGYDESLIESDEWVKIPVTALPDSVQIEAEGDPWVEDSQHELSKSLFVIAFKEGVTDLQCEEINDKLAETMGKNVYLEHLPITMARESDYINTVIVLSLFIGVLASINMAILYRYILEKRSAELAIFRICGCTQEKAMLSYLVECIIISAPLFAFTQLLYHKLVLPHFISIFPHMEKAYGFDFYLMMFIIYIAVSAFIMYRMIKSAVNKHSLVTLKNSKRATNRFGIMKALEISQLAAIISILVIVVSAVTSRYEMFRPFEQYLSHKGYLVMSTDASTYPDELEDMIDGADYIMNQMSDIYFGDPESDEYMSFKGESYSDEFIDLYTPPLIAGKWLNETDETYENSGYIPAVITDSGGKVHLGDILSNDIIMNYDESGNVTEVASIRYKIIGIVDNNAKILSYIPSTLEYTDYKLSNYLDMFNVYSPENEEHGWLFTRISDVVACYGGANGPVHGIQLIFCDDMSDEEYEDVGNKLSVHENFNAEELSTIYENSKLHIYEQMYSLFPVAVCIFILTLISAVSINAIYTKRQLRNYAIFYICGAKWSRCALMSLRNGVMTCIASSVLAAVVLALGKTFLFGDTVISFGMWQLIVCAIVVLLYLILSMIMPLSIIGSAEPREVLKEE